VNGLLVEFGQIDSFIATLGTGTVVYAITLWHTKGQQVIGELGSGFKSIDTAKIFGLHAPTVYLLVVAVLMWIAFEYLPIGRYLFAVGANRRAAELNGIRAGRYVIGAFVTSGLLTAVAGVLLASRLQVGQSNVGLDYLLPAFVGALLGSTTIRPGRFNVWGTVVAVAVLAIGISGIQQLGSSFYVEPLFNGLTLIAAVGLAGYTVRRRVRVRRKQEEDLHHQPTGAPPAPADLPA
jgi:ribose transport system permease protein